MSNEFGADKLSPFAGAKGYSQLLNEARDVSDRALDRLRALRDQFPTAVSGALVEQVERLRSEGAIERRGSLRLNDDLVVTAVTDPSAPADWSRAEVVDHSAGGLALRLDYPVAEGTILLVWLGPVAPDKGWLPIEVKHCRPDEDGWLIGGQILRRADPEQAGGNIANT